MNFQQFPISSFDPLLRDLLHWGLVVREDGPIGSCWRLAEGAESRLDELLAEASPAPLPVERIVFFDYRCSECGIRQMTRVHGSYFICDACWAKSVHPPEPATVKESPREVA